MKQSLLRLGGTSALVLRLNSVLAPETRRDVGWRLGLGWGRGGVGGGSGIGGISRESKKRRFRCHQPVNHLVILGSKMGCFLRYVRVISGFNRRSERLSLGSRWRLELGCVCGEIFDD